MGDARTGPRLHTVLLVVVALVVTLNLTLLTLLITG
jgi:manganese transport protein